MIMWHKNILRQYFLTWIVSVSEKITGVKASQYETVMNEEVEKYFVQEQDLETTISNIKKRADELILMD